jgi:hypothetical protein
MGEAQPRFPVTRVKSIFREGVECLEIRPGSIFAKYGPPENAVCRLNTHGFLYPQPTQNQWRKAGINSFFKGYLYFLE